MIRGWLSNAGTDRKLLDEVRTLLEHDSPSIDPLEDPLNEAIADVDGIAKREHGERFVSDSLIPSIQDQAKSVFDQAMQIESTEERLAYLKSQFGSNPQVRNIVQGLLDALGRDGNAIERTSVATTQTNDNCATIHLRSGSIGPYKILQQIGEGGMGAVYMAEQTQPISRRVALKIIKTGDGYQGGDRPL